MGGGNLRGWWHWEGLVAAPRGQGGGSVTAVGGRGTQGGRGESFRTNNGFPFKTSLEGNGKNPPKIHLEGQSSLLRTGSSHSSGISRPNWATLGALGWSSTLWKDPQHQLGWFIPPQN